VDSQAETVKEMAKQLEAEEASTREADTHAKDDSVPVFKVTQAPGFMTGLMQYPVGSLVRWEKPDAWNAAKWGKHFAEYGPSTTFESMNPAAEKLMKKHKDAVAERARPVPSDLAVLMKHNVAQQDRIDQMMTAMLEQNSLLRRQLDAADQKNVIADLKRK
jgi:hypothetical protein